LIRLFSPLGRDLQTALNGAWSGTAIEHSGAGFNQPRTYEVTWNFKAKRFTLNASSTLRFKNEAGVVIEETFSLKGRYLYGRFVQLEYSNKNRATVNFGTEVLEVPENNRELKGSFVGFSADRAGIITGTIHARRP
jgi:hypothetical protein